jgi:hypothetical protein
MQSRQGIRMALIFSMVAIPMGAAEAPAADPAWTKLKTLVGEWKGRYEGHDAAGAGEVRLSYDLVSSGTALLETMDSAHDATMITVYHPDGSRLMATHYCAGGNQPRLVASGLSPDGKSLTFRFLDATNVTDPKGELMDELVVTFVDADHFVQEWGSRTADKQRIGTFRYTRVR